MSDPNDRFSWDTPENKGGTYQIWFVIDREAFSALQEMEIGNFNVYARDVLLAHLGKETSND